MFPEWILETCTECWQLNNGICSGRADRMEIPIVKYTANGNNFVIIDEIPNSILAEKAKSGFAYRATDINFGVGSDNLLTIQPCAQEILQTINGNREYWKRIPDASPADYVFRMFEPNGIEAFSCANGLICIASHLGRRYGIESARVMTEIPTSQPKVVSIGTYLDTGMSWANVGIPRRIPSNMVQRSFLTPHTEKIDAIENIEIKFRKHDLGPFSDGESLKISGYLTFTGEPHLVVFPHFGFSLKELKKALFVSSLGEASDDRREERRVAFGSWLIHHIGTYINREYAHIFPVGININFVSFDETAGAIEYRCFERGLNRETLSCGTGALAISFIARQFDFSDTNPSIVWPHRSRWHDPDAQVLVKEGEGGWIIFGSPEPLFEGLFLTEVAPTETINIGDYRHLDQPQVLTEVMI